ncbi:MAG: phosphate ABC transporter permease subunit PstC [Gammaproteobacteria bacterium]|nr:phosphate ABC transporter permease subunit PstC [Gammaproteobacteria bacterium]
MRNKKTARQNNLLHFNDTLFQWSLRILGIGVISVLALLIFQLILLSLPTFKAMGWTFFTSHDWDPVKENYGVLSFAYGTVMSSMVALIIACPISIATALFLVEVAPKKIAALIGFLVEMLAAIPSVIYGLWGIFVLAPLLRNTVEPFLAKHLGALPFFQGPPYGIGMLAGGIILAIMITPTITAICKEIFSKIPLQEREAALALGSTRWEMMRIAVLRSSVSGMIGATILGLGRALGETMAVTMVIGNRANISLSLFEPAQTMASVIANEYSEATGDLHLSALAAIGLVLFVISLLTSSLARALVWRIERHPRS